MSKHQLCIRLYFEPHLADLVRAIGYGAWTLEQARERLAPLAAKYGKDKINAAILELLEVDSSQVPALARLSRAARQSAWQLLGPPPAA